jgi:hypothetical protein
VSAPCNAVSLPNIYIASERLLNIFLLQCVRSAERACCFARKAGTTVTRPSRRPAVFFILANVATLLLAACGATPTDAVSLPTATAAATSSVTSAGASLSALPLGDGHVGTSPRVGYVDACTTRFGNVGGAFKDGPWIHGATWDAVAKIAVRGAVTWPQAAYSARTAGDQNVITTTDLPIGYTTGVFPVGATDPAFAYDRNPNTITAKSLQLTLPLNPIVAAIPTCLNMGAIGVLTDGVVLFNALDGEGRDAVAHEVLDTCGGHPEMNGEYHYHDIPPCLLKTATGASTLVGYANDGFGIYVERDAQGNLPTNASLDVCHGRTSVVTWNGQQVNMYHYVATAEYPYTLGCYRGAPARITGG